METKITVVHGIVEAANKPNGKPDYDITQAAQLIKKMSFSGHNTLAVILNNSRDCIKVPTFGYNAFMEASGKYSAMPWGATRMFGFTLVLDGKIDPKTVFGTYEIVPQSLQVILGGMEIDEEERAFTPAKKITLDFVPMI